VIAKKEKKEKEGQTPQYFEKGKEKKWPSMEAQPFSPIAS